jgi:hypothetical protein
MFHNNNLNYKRTAASAGDEIVTAAFRNRTTESAAKYNNAPVNTVARKPI